LSAGTVSDKASDIEAQNSASNNQFFVLTGLLVCPTMAYLAFCKGTIAGMVMRHDSCVDFGAVYIVCLCVYLTSFLTFFFPYFLLNLCFLSYLFTSVLVYFLTYLSTPSIIDQLHCRDRDCRRRPNLALFFVFILCCIIFCYRCMFTFVVFIFVFRY